MKILILTDEYPPIIGGAGIVSKQLYIDLKELGNDVDIFTPAIKRNIFFKIFWPFYYFNIKLFLKLKLQDRIIVNDIRSAYSITLISLFYKIDFKKIIYILHGTEYDIAYNPSIKNKLILLPFIYNLFLKKCNKIVSVSNYTKEIFLKNTTVREKIKNKIEVIYVGISKNIKKYNKYVIDRKDKYFRLVSVSRLEERKGYFEMLDIFIELSKKIPNLEWYIYGDGSIKNRLISEAKNKNIFDKIYFKGAMNREKIYNEEFYKYNFDLFWLLPNQPEAFGLVYIEASSLGVPTMGINKYGIRESVNNLFYTDIKFLVDLINDIKINKDIYIKNAFSFSEAFQSSIFAKKILVI
ncbi:glycosyltransferase family 4 protein [Proteus mirabilis]|uniref:glycosyltransferase family 4 protein n=1 Tax=Proteus mirabilis TaxID=584 RepID=UPI002577AE5E|nr:glycosyltransferase family 4 protein [Proteus mirabilis]MDM3586027.1 glycosyltransferase family 4 protein [Proteus mirabilis]MDM3831661.1 glycosyltransferase family 4 protein [Proteus mirabilis]MEC4045872.1 glycosyltransferase family 4 protein [Proteus mirabilis]